MLFEVNIVVFEKLHKFIFFKVRSIKLLLIGLEMIWVAISVETHCWELFNVEQVDHFRVWLSSTHSHNINILMVTFDISGQVHPFIMHRFALRAIF